MQIKIAKKEDIKTLVKLNRMLCKHITRIDRHYQADKQTEKAFRVFCSKNLQKTNFRYLLAENNKGEVIGYLSARILKSSPFVVPKRTGEILGCFVLERYRRKGIGKQLFRKIAEWFRENKVKHGEIEVHSKNKPSIKFWQKLGFKECMKKMRLNL